MLTDLLLNIVSNPEELKLLGRKRTQVMKKYALSAKGYAAVKKGDIHKLRAVLYEEVSGKTGRKAGSQPYLASDYTVSSSCDTPHCPVNMSGAVHPSFWDVMQPDPLWDVNGLTIVGTGIRASLQTTPEALARIKNASKVLYLVADILSQIWIKKLNPSAESMQGLYKKGAYRLDIYNNITRKILSALQEHSDVCVIFYGHPGSFVYPAHEAIRLARKKGYKARMLPGVSAEANLFADLGVDAGITGIQSYEATNFVLNKYRFDTCAGLLLWQISMFGYAYWTPKYQASPDRLKFFVNYMKDYYPLDHEVVLYEASELPLGNPKVQRLPLRELPRAKYSGVSTLYIPPKACPSTDRDLAKQLGIPVGRPLVKNKVQ